MPNELFSTASLGSYAGLVAATYLLVTFFKDPVKKYLNDWWVRILAVVIAFGIQAFVLYVGGTLTVETIGLALLNAFLIAITAAGTHELTKPGSPVPPQVINQTIIQPALKPQVPDIAPKPMTIPSGESETTATVESINNAV
jgi:hypothetical protein